MRALTIALGVAAGAAVLAFALQVFDAEPRVVATDGVRPIGFVAQIPAGGGTVCQPGEPLEPKAKQLDMTIGTYGRPGPELDVEMRHVDDVVARGKLRAGWHQGPVSIPLRVVDSGARVGVLCVRSHGGGRVIVAGVPTAQPPARLADGTPTAGRMSALYLSEPRSLAAMAPDIVARYGHGTARWLGGWTWVVMGLLLVAALVSAGLTLLRARVAEPWPIARAAALTAVLIGTVWALLIPPFHVPDEVSHLAYAQYVAETGKLPRADAPGLEYSSEERALIAAVNFYSIIGRSDVRPPNTAGAEQALRSAESAPLPRDDGANATTASPNPPLYYLLEAAVYRLAPGGLLDELLPMRLLSVLLGGLTVLFITLFLAELLPRSPWTWAGGGLAVALQPTFGFITAGVNADALLFACSAAMFLVAARVLRRGLTVRRAAALAAVTAAGVLTKPLFLALVPAAALTVLIGALRAGGAPTVRFRPFVVAAVVFAAPVVLYQVAGAVAFDHPYFAAGSGVAAVGGPAADATASLSKELSFIWQLFLPQAPFLQDQFEGEALRQIWLNGLLGRLGWLDYSLPGWVYTWGLWAALALVAAFVASLVVHRRAVRSRLSELAVYVTAVLCVAVVVGVQDYSAHQARTGAFEQVRYLFPLLALYGGVIAVALRLAGPRRGPPAATLVAGVAAVHTITALTATVVRYYS